MLKNIEEIIERLKKDTNNSEDIVYRKKIIKKTKLYIIYDEPLASSDKISDFIIRSLNNISNSKITSKELLEVIENDISNFKVTTFDTYDKIGFYIHNGFTVILIDGEDKGLALETKADISRGVGTPETENTVRGARDAFTEDYQINLGLIKKRIKTSNLWVKSCNVGKYTQTKVSILSINGIVKPELVDKVYEKIKKIDIDGIINSDMIKNSIHKENKSLFPTVLTTERPDIVSKALLNGKIAVVVDNSPYVLVIPGLLNDYFKTMEDIYGKSLNVTFTRLIKFLCFFISILTPAIYIALITYNHEMIPSDLLINFAVQRDGVPFPAFFEAFIMIIAFEILKESDLRVPSFSGSALSIVGALILGEAAVNAGIVSPIMIIIISITAISSLPFSETELVNSIRWYRILFMLWASFLGIVGVILCFMFFVVKLSSVKSFGKPYLMPFAPTDFSGLKNSIVRYPLKSQKKRPSYLSNNTIRQRNDENEIS